MPYEPEEDQTSDLIMLVFAALWIALAVVAFIY